MALTVPPCFFPKGKKLPNNQQEKTMTLVDLFNPWRVIRRLTKQNTRLRLEIQSIRRKSEQAIQRLQMETQSIRRKSEQAIELLQMENRVLQKRSEQAIELLQMENRVLQERSEYDIVTGGRNRHGLEQAVTLALKTLANQHLVEENDTKTMPLLPLAPLAFMVSVLFIDLDHFKMVNDRYGHPRGDQVLRDAFEIINSCVRGVFGLTGRYGGDEFVAVLPCADQSTAYLTAEKIRQLIEQRFQLECGVTVSIGVSSLLFRVGESPRDFLPQVVKISDRAMYDAKESGRNKVRLLAAESFFDRRR